MSLPALDTTDLTVAELIAQGDVDLVVYSKPSCVQCNATYRAVDRAGLRAVVIDIPAMNEQQQAEFDELLAETGFLAAPVVVAPASGERWAGFQPDRISAARA